LSGVLYCDLGDSLLVMAGLVTAMTSVDGVANFDAT
jgi:hypothetical protein